MNTSKERLRQFIVYKGFNVSKISKELSIAKSNFNEKTMHLEISTPILCKFMNFFPDLSADWVLTGNGPMLKNTSDSSIDSNISVKEPNTHSNTKVDYKEKYYELLEENRELRLKMERIEDKHNIELEKLKETHQKQVQETEKCKKELEKFRKSKNNNALLPV